MLFLALAYVDPRKWTLKQKLKVCSEFVNHNYSDDPTCPKTTKVHMRFIWVFIVRGIYYFGWSMELKRGQTIGS